MAGNHSAAHAADLQVHGVSVADGTVPSARPPRHTVMPRLPVPSLRDMVTGYVGFTREVRLPAVQRALPGSGIPLVLRFEPAPGRLITPNGGMVIPPLPVVGLHDRPVLVDAPASPYGVAVILTPPGAYALFGIPLVEIANSYIDLADLLGDRIWELAEQLAGAPSWSARFALLDRVLPAWLHGGHPPDAAILDAWRRLHQSAGQLPIGHLADALGVSRRYVEKGFKEQIGLSPKTVARVLRFRHATRLLTTAGPSNLTQVAAACGYSDLAHLDREFNALAGGTPTDFLTQRTLEPAHPRS